MRWLWLLAHAAAAFTTLSSSSSTLNCRPLFLHSSSSQHEDLSQLSRAELEALVVKLREENSMLLFGEKVDPGKFDVFQASALAGYAFESYNAPQGARWERGADGCDVAFSSADFVRTAYAGAVVVRVLRANGLRREQRDLTEIAMTGGQSDPYVTMAVVESSEGTLMERAGNATDVARTSTIWRGGSDVEWSDDEYYTLFVRDPSTARLALSVMDEDMGEDDVLGAAEIPSLAAIFAEKDNKKTRETLQLRADSESKVLDTGAGFAGAAVAAIAGVATAGVAAVAIAAAAAAAAANERRGQLEVELQYFSFGSNEDVVKLAPTLPVVPTPEPPTGATPGIDWTGFAVEGASYEPLCFVDHRHTGTQAGIWRDEKRKRLLVSFRGTSEPRDVVTDASAVMTPWARDARKNVDGYNSVPAAAGDPRVHAGFRGALESIALRLKQLLVLAAQERTDWTLELTGHSLGGALATLFALEVAEGIDLTRPLPLRRPLGQSWIVDVIGGGGATVEAAAAAAARTENRVKIASDLHLITFGAPRTGDAAFTAALDAAVPKHFRVVNDQDIVARLPRGFAYAHAGRTVMVKDDAENDEDAALWIEGEDGGECPLKINDDIRTDTDEKQDTGSPFSLGGSFSELLDSSLTNTTSKIVMDGDGDGAAWNPFGTTIENAKKLKDIALDTITSPTQIAKLAGVDLEYAEIELKLLAALSSGDAINHHLEPAYFGALDRARRRRREQEDDGTLEAAERDEEEEGPDLVAEDATVELPPATSSR